MKIKLGVYSYIFLFVVIVISLFVVSGLFYETVSSPTGFVTAEKPENVMTSTSVSIPKIVEENDTNSTLDFINT